MPLSAMRLFLCGVAAACVSAARPAWCPETVTSVTQVRAVCNSHGNPTVSLQTGNYSCLGTDCEGILRLPACPERPALPSYSCDALRHICADLNSRLELADTNSSTGGEYLCDTCIAHPPPFDLAAAEVHNAIPSAERGWTVGIAILICVAFAGAGGAVHHQLNKEQAANADATSQLTTQDVPEAAEPADPSFRAFLRKRHCWLSLKHGDPKVVSLRNRLILELSCCAFSLGVAVLCTGLALKSTTVSFCDKTMSTETQSFGSIVYKSDYSSTGLWILAFVMPILWGISTFTFMSAATRTPFEPKCIVIVIATCALFVFVAFYMMYKHRNDPNSLDQSYTDKERAYFAVFLAAYLSKCLIFEPLILLVSFKVTQKKMQKKADADAAAAAAAAGAMPAAV